MGILGHPGLVGGKSGTRQLVTSATLQETKIAMENELFIEDLPIKIVIFHSCVSLLIRW